jgi:hypothetical protein
MKTPTAGTYGLPLSLIGIAVGVAGVAIGLDQIHASEAAVWSVAGVATLCFVGAAILFARRTSGAPRAPTPNPRLAAECRRLAKALATFADEIAHARAAIPVGGRIDAWQVEARHRYREELESWAAQVFDAAVAAGAIVDCSRALVESPAPAQLHVVRDLFLEAALALDPRSSP